MKLLFVLEKTFIMSFFEKIYNFLMRRQIATAPFNEYKKEYIQLLIFALLSILSIVIYNIQSAKTEKQYINSFTLKFAGVIEEQLAELSGNKMGLFRVSIDYSTTKNYDVRDSLYRYFCVIKKDKAEVIIYSYDVKVGDFIYVDGIQKKYNIYRNDELLYSGNISLHDYLTYFQARRAHRL